MAPNRRSTVTGPDSLGPVISVCEAKVAIGLIGGHRGAARIGDEDTASSSASIQGKRGAPALAIRAAAPFSGKRPMNRPAPRTVHSRKTRPPDAMVISRIDPVAPDACGRTSETLAAAIDRRRQAQKPSCSRSTLRPATPVAVVSASSAVPRICARSRVSLSFFIFYRQFTRPAAGSATFPAQTDIRARYFHGYFVLARQRLTNPKIPLRQAQTIAQTEQDSAHDDNALRLALALLGTVAACGTPPRA
jgi:hypothetical protein